MHINMVKTYNFRLPKDLNYKFYYIIYTKLATLSSRKISVFHLLIQYKISMDEQTLSDFILLKNRGLYRTNRYKPQNNLKQNGLFVSAAINPP